MFNEANSVEDFVISLISQKRAENGWSYVPATQLDRVESDVLIESEVRDALVRLNPEIQANPDYADEVLYRLRAIILSVGSDGLPSK